MRKALAIILALFSEFGLCLAQEQTVPIRRVLPEDIVQGSIEQFQVITNKIVVRWKYTEAGARRMLAFGEANEGKIVRTTIGKFEVQSHGMDFRPMPPVLTNYARWK